MAAAQRLQAAGVAAAPVAPSHSLWLDEHLRASGYWVVLNRRYVGDHLIPNSPVLFDGRRLKVTHPAPTLGEHTASALASLEI
jgi:crotonobetainyl-CoA:carnitine CoA-transferase CaiB-like acyl-CoA transferase